MVGHLPLEQSILVRVQVPQQKWTLYLRPGRVIIGNMEANIWFYTFSTAAQVMAALAGLFAVFVVYKIQDFSGLISDARSSLARLMSYTSPNVGGDPITVEDITQMGDREMVMTLAELLVLQTPQNGHFFTGNSERVGNINFSVSGHTYDYFSALVQKKEQILRRLIFVLALSLGAIGVALTALVMTNYLLDFKWFIWAALALFLFTLGVIGKNIYDITIK